MLHNISGRLKCGPGAITSGVIPLTVELLTVPKVEFDTVLITGTVLARGYYFSQHKKLTRRSFLLGPIFTLQVALRSGSTVTL